MLCTCGHKSNIKSSRQNLLVHGAFNYDPTRTITLRNQFVSAMNRRFKQVRKLIKQSIVDRDCFGLIRPTGVRVLEATSQQQFAFETDQNKVKGFMAWLQNQIDNNILEIYTAPQLGASVGDNWTDLFIRTAYQKGITRARQELINAGYEVPPFEDGTLGQSLSSAFNAPVHLDRAGVLYTRTFENLKGITTEMSKQISGILAQGILDGKHPRDLAEEIVDRVDKIGITRARTLARTEIIRAHHVATIQEYQNWQVADVKVKAEWSTAGDGRVCEVCASLEGRVFTLKEIAGMIPRHPNCRCIALPVDVTEEEAPAKAKKE